jgi:hypothetical protein
MSLQDSSRRISITYGLYSRFCEQPRSCDVFTTSFRRYVPRFTIKIDTHCFADADPHLSWSTTCSNGRQGRRFAYRRSVAYRSDCSMPGGCTSPHSSVFDAYSLVVLRFLKFGMSTAWVIQRRLVSAVFVTSKPLSHAEKKLKLELEQNERPQQRRAHVEVVGNDNVHPEGELWQVVSSSHLSISLTLQPG